MSTRNRNDLSVQGLIFPGSFTTAQILSINGSSFNNGAIIFNNTLNRFEMGVGSNFVPLFNGLLLSDITGTVVPDGAVLCYNSATNKYIADSSLIINKANSVISTRDNTGAKWTNWEIGTLGSAILGLKRSLGDLTTQTAVTDNIKLGGLAFLADYGVLDTSYDYISAEVLARSLGMQSASNHGAKLLFNVIPLNSTVSKTIIETNTLGEPVLNDYPSSRNDGIALNALYTDSTGQLKHGPITFFDDAEISANATLGAALLPIQNRLYRYYVNSNVILTPDVGSRFLIFDYNSRFYTALTINATYTQGSYNTHYDIQRLGTDIYLREVSPPKNTVIKLINNTGTDVITNYNTVGPTAVRLSTISFSYNNINNNITLSNGNGTFTTNYNGYIEFNCSLTLNCGTANNTLVTRITNITTGVVEVSAVTRTTTGNGATVTTIQQKTVLACAPGNIFQVQLQRYGTSTTTATLSKILTSSIIAKNYFI